MADSPYGASVKPEYVCPNCRGSFSMPLEVTCADHRPEPVYFCAGCGATYETAERAANCAKVDLA